MIAHRREGKREETNKKGYTGVQPYNILYLLSKAVNSGLIDKIKDWNTDRYRQRNEQTKYKDKVRQ